MNSVTKNYMGILALFYVYFMIKAQLEFLQSSIVTLTLYLLIVKGLTWQRTLLLLVLYFLLFQKTEQSSPETHRVTKICPPESNKRRAQNQSITCGWDFGQKTFTPSSPNPQISAAIQDFLSKDLDDSNVDTTTLSVQLTDACDVITESQRIHMEIFTKYLKDFKYVVYMDVATYPNKGDPAITIGQTLLMRKLGIKIIEFCYTAGCTKTQIMKMRERVEGYPKEKVMVLLTGGGNLLSYKFNDQVRKHMLTIFSDYKCFMLPQSIYVVDNKEREMNTFNHTAEMYERFDNLTIFFRDKKSIEISKQLWPKTLYPRTRLLPDMAFHIGPVRRTMSPSYDIIWLRRED